VQFLPCHDHTEHFALILTAVAADDAKPREQALAELKEAVQVMADVQFDARLPDDDAAAIVSFLESVTGEIPSNYHAPRAKP